MSYFLSVHIVILWVYFFTHHIRLKTISSFSADIETPVITSNLNFVVKEANTDSSSASVTWQEPSITDNSGVFTVTSNFNSGDNFPMGTTQVTYIAIDSSGNQDTFVFTVIVNGVQKRFKSYSTTISTSLTGPGVTVVDKVSSRIRCSRLCLASEQCVSFAFDATSKSCFLKESNESIEGENYSQLPHYKSD